MDMYTTRPVKELKLKEFKDLLKGKEISISSHALDHLSNKQRKLFKSEDMILMVKRDNPRKVYLQLNGRYAAYYRRKNDFQKLIMDILPDKGVIITFMNIANIPKVIIKNGD